MSVDAGKVNVIVPDKFGGAVVCELLDLVNRLDDDDYEDLDAVLDDASFDSTFHADGRELRLLISRVRVLNETDDDGLYHDLAGGWTCEACHRPFPDRQDPIAGRLCIPCAGRRLSKTMGQLLVSTGGGQR